MTETATAPLPKSTASKDKEFSDLSRRNSKALWLLHRNQKNKQVRVNLTDFYDA